MRIVYKALQENNLREPWEKPNSVKVDKEIQE